MPYNEIIKAIAAFGVWPALPLTGAWLFGRFWGGSTNPLPLKNLFSLYVTAGVAVWSFVLIALVLVNLYQSAWVGVMGWIAAAYMFWSLKKNQPSLFSTAKLSGGLALILFFASIVYLGFPTESIYIDRDQGVYTNHAIYMANHGRSDIFYPWPENLNALFGPSWAGFPGFFGFYPRMIGQFPHGFTIWLSQAYASFGYFGLVRLNGVFALLAAAIFYQLVRIILPQRYALGATFLFAFNPAQIWLARITLAEVLVQLFVLSGLLLLTLAIKDQNKILARWGGIFVAFSALIRLDSFMLLPLLMLAHLLHKTITSTEKRGSSEVWRTLYETAFPLFALSYMYYHVINPWYYAAHQSIIQPAVVASGILLALLLFLPRFVLVKMSAAIRSRLFVFGLSFAVLLLAVFGYWVRPQLEPFALLPNSNSRSFIELTLVNLAQYLSFPAVWIAIPGWLALAWAMLRKNAETHLIALWIVGGGSALIYLYNPHVTPDHFWAIRRFVPMVIPALIAFAAYGVWLGLKLLSQRSAKIGEALGFLGVVLFLGLANFRILGFSEFKGAFKQIEALAKKLPQDEIILADGYSMWISPLYFVFNKKVIPIDMSKEEGFRVVREWIKLNKENGKPVYILRGNREMYQPLAAYEIDRTLLTHSFFEHTPFPLPKSTVEESIPISLYQIAERPSLLNRAFGAMPVATIKESGFSDPETDRTGPFRWTQGRAMLGVPVEKAPRQLFISFFTGVPDTKLKILVNGFPIFAGALTKGEWVKTFDLPHLAAQNTVTITLLSDTFVPARANWGSRDNRVLGVAIREIVLKP